MISQLNKPSSVKARFLFLFCFLKTQHWSDSKLLIVNDRLSISAKQLTNSKCPKVSIRFVLSPISYTKKISSFSVLSLSNTDSL